MTSPIRLEIIEDNAVTAPRLSRVLPAILYNVVAESSYLDFCDKIDPLLSLAAMDYKCRAKRLLWWNLGFTFWVVVFFGCYFATLLELSKSDLFHYLTCIFAIVGISYLVIIRIWMNCPTGTTPATETMKEIRAECEAMTHRTPHASFHVVLSPLATAVRVHHLYANPIQFIEVSLSVVGIELARTTGLPRSEAHNTSGINTLSATPPAVLAASTVTNDYQQLGIV